MLQVNRSPTAAVATVIVELVCDVVVNSLYTGAREWLWSRSITLSHWHKRKTLSSDFITGLLIDSLWHGRALQGPPRWMEVGVNTEGRYRRVQVDVGWSVRKSSFINHMKCWNECRSRNEERCVSHVVEIPKLLKGESIIMWKLSFQMKVIYHRYYFHSSSLLLLVPLMLYFILHLLRPRQGWWRHYRQTLMKTGHNPDVNVQTTRTICVRKTIATQMFKRMVINSN